MIAKVGVPIIPVREIRYSRSSRLAFSQIRADRTSLAFKPKTLFLRAAYSQAGTEGKFDQLETTGLIPKPAGGGILPVSQVAIEATQFLNYCDYLASMRVEDRIYLRRSLTIPNNSHKDRFTHRIKSGKVFMCKDTCNRES